MRIKSILIHYSLFTIHYSLFTIPFFATAAVTQRWEVETSRVQPVVFEAIHGETLSLEASFKSYGTGVSTSNMTAFLCWQTNGMANAWWVTNAVTSGNSASVMFTPSMDPGSSSVVGFIGLSDATNNQLPSALCPLPSISYRAAFTIRFRHGPGERPNTIEGPVPILDFSHTTVIKPPWPAEIAAATNGLAAAIAAKQDALVSGTNIKTVNGNSLLGAGNIVISGGGGGGVDEGAVNGLIRSYDETNIAARIAAKQDARDAVTTNGLAAALSANEKTGTDQQIMRGELYQPYGVWQVKVEEANTANSATYATTAESASTADSAVYAANAGTATYASTAGEVAGISFSKVYNTPTTLSGYGILDAYTKTEVDGTTVTNGGAKAYADATFADKTTVNQLGANVTAIGALLNAEDARFVSTNYDSVVRMPEAYVEIKVNNNWQTIWKEMTRWGKFVGNAFEWNPWQGFHAWSTNVMAQLETKAERCWGIYDSETGEISPDGYTQISSSNILIAANMSYKRVVAAANAIWVLESNSGLATLGGTNGYFRIKDGDGNTQFEIIKGNLRELGCDAGGITVNNSGSTPVLTIPYSVVAASHPTLKICTDLTTADWKAESEATCAATVAWSGSSGAYVATVTAKSASSAMFVKATYMGGSETIINNIAPTKLQYIYIGNTKYSVGYTTISGTGVMTLTPQ